MGRAGFAGSREICERGRPKVSLDQEGRATFIKHSLLACLKNIDQLRLRNLVVYRIIIILRQWILKNILMKKAWLISIVEQKNCDKIKERWVNEG